MGDIGDYGKEPKKDNCCGDCSHWELVASICRSINPEKLKYPVAWRMACPAFEEHRNIICPADQDQGDKA